MYLHQRPHPHPTFMAYKRWIKYGKETTNKRKMKIETMNSKHQEKETEKDVIKIILLFVCDFVFVFASNCCCFSFAVCMWKCGFVKVVWAHHGFWNQLEFVHVQYHTIKNSNFHVFFSYTKRESVSINRSHGDISG